MSVNTQKREVVILLDRGIKLAGYLKYFLSNKEVISVNSVEQAIKKKAETACDIFVCSLMLSHCSSLEDCLAAIARLGAVFRNIAFFEPSNYGTTYLAGFDLKNFHTGFRSNRLSGDLSVGLFLDHSSAYSVTHLGCNAAVDSGAHWIVPTDFPAEVFPSSNTVTPEIRFEFPLYEYSCFLFSSFDAAVLDLEDDLTFIEKRIRKSPIQLSGIDPTRWTVLKDAGPTIYVTGDDPDYARETRGLEEFVRRSHIDRSELRDSTAESTWIGGIAPQNIAARVTRLANCIVAGTGAVISDGRFIAESNYLLPFIHGENAVREGMGRPHPVGHIAGLAIIAMNAVSYNYYHWVAQIAPFLDICRRLIQDGGQKNVTIVTGRIFSFHDEFVKLLFREFDEVNLVSLKKSEFVTVDFGLYSNIMGYDTPTNLVTEQVPMATWLKQALADKDAPVSRLLYISRGDTKARPMKNESALIDRLRARGFEILALSEMSVKDQILAFSQARIVIGGHGAGFANILFASGQTHLIELMQSTYPNNCMLRLAQNAGVRHTAKFFLADGSSPPVSSEWSVDVDQVSALLDRVLPPALDEPLTATATTAHRRP